jgi:hypothetical protein
MTEKEMTNLIDWLQNGLTLDQAATRLGFDGGLDLVDYLARDARDLRRENNRLKAK